MSHNDFHVEPQYVGMNYNHLLHCDRTVSGICILLERFGAMGTICLRSMAELLRVSEPHASGLLGNYLGVPCYWAPMMVGTADTGRKCQNWPQIWFRWVRRLPHFSLNGAKHSMEDSNFEDTK
jgi:hypothetical protein